MEICGRAVRRIIIWISLFYLPNDAHASVYLQRTRPGPVSLIAINIQCVVYLPRPNACFALGSRLDRLLDERSVVPASRGYKQGWI